jgi:hypothetical protein
MTQMGFDESGSMSLEIHAALMELAVFNTAVEDKMEVDASKIESAAEAPNRGDETESEAGRRLADREKGAGQADD